MKRSTYLTFYKVSLVISLLACYDVAGQDQRPLESNFVDPTTSFWAGTYLNARITDKIFWAGEFHFRTTENENTPYFGQMAQIYNRHGIKYLFSKNLSMTLGGVARIDFTPEPGNKNLKSIIIEPRIWHEYFFAMPFPRFMVYHRLRVEHRWSKNHQPGAEYFYRDRWRYKFFMKIPLNKPTLVPGAVYFSPDIEIIMQSGRRVIDSPLEDLRIYPIIGYIASPRYGFSTGMMYTLGQNLSMGGNYRQRWIFRINAYLSLDFRSLEEKIPESKFFD